VNILHSVESFYPSLGGTQELVRQVSERLVNRGHSVTVATAANANRASGNMNGVRVAEFHISGSLVRGLKGDVESYRHFLLHSEWDILCNFSAQNWATDIPLGILPGIRAKKILIPTGFSGLGLPAYRAYYRSMIGWMRQYDRIVFHSSTYRDVSFVRACGIPHFVVIPNGADEREFMGEMKLDVRAKLGIPRDDFLILHVGSFTGFKGHAEAFDIFRKARIQNATLLMIGAPMPSSYGVLLQRFRVKRRLFRLGLGTHQKSLIVASLPREDTVAAFKQADLFLFPSNVECSPIVLFESMASKTPFLSTDVGNAEEIARWSHSGMILPTWKLCGFGRARIRPSAGMLERLYLDDEKRTQMAEDGFMAWKERFTWDEISREYEDLYRKAVLGP
jgi:glycosyltransferase involved in cell wall biosynthesis